MKKFLFVVLLLSFMLIELPYPQVLAQSTLADTINSVVEGNVWSNYPSVISVGMIFGKSTASAFESTGGWGAHDSWAWVRQLASVNGYTSQTIDNEVKNMMSSMTMSGYVPITLNGVWVAAHRFMVPLYDLASQWGLASKWSKSEALAEVQSNLAGHMPLLGFSSSGGWYYNTRYYDEWIEDLDLVLKMGDTSTAATLWAGVNSNNWNGQIYGYTAGSDVAECEVGFFASIVGNYKVTVGNIPNFDRVSTDLYNKLLVSGWSSQLWGGPSMMKHATSNSELRLHNTIGGIEALHMYYGVSDSTFKSKFISLLSNGPAWKEFATCSLFSRTDSWSNAIKASLLLLYGIIPDSGSLAIPTNEWRYEDWETMMPSTLFKFNYASRTIRIPVFAGKLKFCFGSSITSYTFPSTGVYQVQFSSDWNSVTSANNVGGLPTQFHFLGVSSPPAGSITVGSDVLFEAWYDSVSHVTVPAGQTYTFTNVPAGSQTVYGKYGDIEKSDTVTVNSGQITSYTFDFSIYSKDRPPWWPDPLPWPLTGFASTIVSTWYLFLLVITTIFAGTIGPIWYMVRMRIKPHRIKPRRKGIFF